MTARGAICVSCHIYLIPEFYLVIFKQELLFARPGIMVVFLYEII